MSQQYPPEYNPWQRPGANPPPPPPAQPAYGEGYPPPVQEGYPPVQQPYQQGGNPSPFGYQPPQAPPSRRRYGVIALVLTLVVLLIVAISLSPGFFKIKAVHVKGEYVITPEMRQIPEAWKNSHVMRAEEVIEAAGLQGKVGYFSLNEEKIEQSISENRYLIYQGMEAEFPSTVTLYVRVRQPWVDIQVMGIAYRMDEEGMVLERDGAVSLTGERMVVTGLQPREIRVGQKIIAINPRQQQAYLAVMEELLLQQFYDEISELNLTDPNNLYLITRDGYTIHLGDEEQMQAKIGTVRGVIAKLHEMGKFGGIIEVKVPGEATYSPVGK